MRYRTQIRSRRPARGVATDAATSVASAVISEAAEAIALVAARVGDPAEDRGTGEVTVEIDPEASLVGEANLQVLPRAQAVCERTGITAAGLGRLLEQRSEMALLYGTASELDRDLGDGEAVVQAVEAREVRRLVRGLRGLLSSQPADFAEQLGSDAAEVLRLDDELKTTKKVQRMRTMRADKATSVALDEQERRQRLLHALIERRRGGSPDPGTLAEAHATFGSAEGALEVTPAPAPAAARRRRPR